METFAREYQRMGRAEKTPDALPEKAINATEMNIEVVSHLCLMLKSMQSQTGEKQAEFGQIDAIVEKSGNMPREQLKDNVRYLWRIRTENLQIKNWRQRYSHENTGRQMV
jgi:hypothetical protein